MKRVLPLAFLSIAGGLIAHIGVFYFIRIEIPVPRSAPADSVQVQYVGDLGNRADPGLREQSLLQDSAPLFMPTKWNPVSQMDDVASLREATEVFAQYSPDLTLPYSTPGSFPREIKGAQPPGLSLPDSPAFYLSRFGRETFDQITGIWSDSTVQPKFLGGTVVRKLRSSSLPEAIKARSPRTMWAPLNIYLHLVDGLPLGRPVIAESSGFSEWDQAVQDFVGSLSYYRSLQSGYYRITVYP